MHNISKDILEYYDPDSHAKDGSTSLKILKYPMTNFCKTKIRGEVYSFDHRQSHQFDIAVKDKTHRAVVHYTSHVFTEEISDDTTPDLFNDHNGECRAFCFERYEQSKILPQFIASHDWRYVYHSYQKNYFLVKNLTPHPYYIFLKANGIARKGDVSVVINVVSAHAKKRQITSIPAIRFARPIQLLAEGKKIKRGKNVPVRIRD